MMLQSVTSEISEHQFEDLVRRNLIFEEKLKGYSHGKEYSND
jgi:hypothetical protein